MQIFPWVEQQLQSCTVPGIRVMLLTDRPEGATAQRLAGYGALVEVEDELFTAISALQDDPLGYDLFVMDCDAYDGIVGGERAIAALIAAEARMRVMLVSGEFEDPSYPMGRRSAVCLPEGASDAAFRHGFIHVLRDRTTMTMM